jgi:hypothetical protein
MMSGRPSHTAYVVKSSREGSDEKPVWRVVGSVWPHKNGTGFDLVIIDQISVSGRIVCTETKETPSR